MALAGPLDAPSRSPAYTGILPCQKIREMITDRQIAPTEGCADISTDQIQPASVDLRLGALAYPVDASFLPGHGKSVPERMQELDRDFRRFAIDLRAGAVLEKGRVYVVPLQE